MTYLRALTSTYLLLLLIVPLTSSSTAYEVEVQRTEEVNTLDQINQSVRKRLGLEPRREWTYKEKVEVELRHGKSMKRILKSLKKFDVVKR